MNITQQLAQSFQAFNQNAMNSLTYTTQQNIWFVLIAFSAIASIIMMLREELDYSVNEEQNIM